MEIDSGSAGTVLIAGCGYAGTRLARHLAPQGPVLALVRRESSAEALRREGIPASVVDFDVWPSVIPIPEGLAAVAYLAPPPDTGTEEVRFRHFLEALGPVRPGVLLYVSTTGVYGDTGGAPVAEDTPPAPREDRSRRRLDAEAQAMRWCSERGVRPVVLRVSAIYGPHRLPLDRLWRGEPVLRGEDSGPGNRIHVDDLVAACLAVLERPVTGVFNLSDGHPEPMAVFTRRVAALAGLPPPPEVDWVEAQRALSPGLLAFLRESRLVLSRRLSVELGLTPRAPETGIRESLREMGYLL